MVYFEIEQMRQAQLNVTTVIFTKSMILRDTIDVLQDKEKSPEQVVDRSTMVRHTISILS